MLKQILFWSFVYFAIVGLVVMFFMGAHEDDPK